MASSLSLDLNTKFSSILLEIYLMYFFLRCVCRDPMNCGFMIKFIYEKYLNLVWILLCMIGYLCKSLRSISLVCPTRLIFLAMGEVLSFGFNLAVLNPSIERETTRIVLLPSRIKRWGLYHISWFYPLHHVILLKALLCSSWTYTTKKDTSVTFWAERIFSVMLMTLLWR